MRPPSVSVDMLFVPQKAVKGQALADFLAAHPVPESSKLHEDILDEVFEFNITSEDEVVGPEAFLSSFDDD